MHFATKIKFFLFKVFGIVLLIQFYSCGENPFSKHIKEGVIEYSIDYPKIPEDNVMLDLMPKKMHMYFKNDNFRSDIIAGMGLFKTSILRNSQTNKLLHTVKMLNKKYACSLTKEDIIHLNPEFQEVEIEYTNNKKEIAGLNCKEAIVRLKSIGKEFKIFYTTEIKLKNPNFSTPFEQINGVLMEYETENYDTHMHFKAEKVSEKEISDTELSLEDDYKMVSVDALDQELKNIFEKLK